MQVVRLEAGRLLWGAIRNAVQDLNMRGYQASVKEGSGFLSRPFWVTIDDRGAPLLRQWFKQFEE